LVYGILITPDTSTKAVGFLNALYESAQGLGIDARVSKTYQPCDVLILYGLGGAYRFSAAEGHLQQGKNFIAWDLPYWQRNGKTFRMSVNGNHPREVMWGEYPGSARFDAAGLTTGKTGNPEGPILLIGNGPKSNAVGADGWARRKSKEIRQTFPDKRIVYRPKPKRPHEDGVIYHDVSEGPLDELLHIASLVVCRHSNVAIDACRMGVPVVCDAGAAASIYPSKLADFERQPSEALRIEFLHRLAWWQYATQEADLAWQWIAYASTWAAATGSRTAISI